jgi:hypothetical protein
MVTHNCSKDLPGGLAAVGQLAPSGERARHRRLREQRRQRRRSTPVGAARTAGDLRAAPREPRLRRRDETARWRCLDRALPAHAQRRCAPGAGFSRSAGRAPRRAALRARRRGDRQTRTGAWGRERRRPEGSAARRLRHAAFVDLASLRSRLRRARPRPVRRRRARLRSDRRRDGLAAVGSRGRGHRRRDLRRTLSLVPRGRRARLQAARAATGRFSTSRQPSRRIGGGCFRSAAPSCPRR